MKLTEIEKSFIQELSNEIKNILKESSLYIAKKYYDEDFESHYKIKEDKRDYLDVVTNIDKEVEERIYNALKNKFPQLGFDMEEKKEMNISGKDFTCYIDPIDGTKYFSKHIPLFSTMLGVKYKDEPILGAVYNPLTNENFFGSILEKTNRNGKFVSVSNKSKLSESIINTNTTPYIFNWDDYKEWLYEKVKLFQKSFFRIRSIGSSGLVLSWVSQGGLDACVYLSNSPDYDTVAGRSLVKYAGGKSEFVFIPKINDTRLICSNPYLFDNIVELLLSN